MRKYIIFILLFPASFANAELSNSAIILALEHQSTVRLDYDLANQLDSMLNSAVKFYTVLKNDTAIQDYSWNELIILPADTNDWITKLLNGELTGVKYIDSLNQVFHFVSASLLNSEILLKFNDTLNIEKLSQLYNKVYHYINEAHPNHQYYNQNHTDIVFSDACLSNKLVFIEPLPGNMNRYWYFLEDDSNNNYKSILIELDTFSFSPPKIYLWNIPGRYDATVFNSVDEIVDSITKSKNWWVRNHAIVVAKNLFIYDYRWNIEDTVVKWQKLQSDIVRR